MLCIDFSASLSFSFPHSSLALDRAESLITRQEKCDVIAGAPLPHVYKSLSLARRRKENPLDGSQNGAGVLGGMGTVN